MNFVIQIYAFLLSNNFIIDLNLTVSNIKIIEVSTSSYHLMSWWWFSFLSEMDMRLIVVGEGGVMQIIFHPFCIFKLIRILEHPAKWGKLF